MNVEEGGAYDYLLEEQIAPVVQSSLGSFVELPYGVTFTDEEIITAIGGVLTMDWVKAQATATLDAVGPYLIGETDDFQVDVDLAEPKVLAAGVLVDTADLKLRQVYESLRICTLPELAGLSLSLDELPPCRPPLITYNQLKGLVGLDVLDVVVQSVIEPLPNNIILDDVTIFAALGDTGGVGDRSPRETLNVIRDTMKDGFTFTDEDMTALIRDQASSPEQAEEYLDLLEDVRGYLRDGFVFTEQDLLQQAGNNANLQTFDEVRAYVHQGRTYLIWLILVPILLASLIGVLGGRNLGSRVAWAGVPIFIAAVLAVIAFGPATDYGFSAADPFIAERDDIPDLVKAKILEVRDALRASFISPIAVQSTIIAILGLAMIVGGAFVSSRRGKQASGAARQPSKRAMFTLPRPATDD